MKKFYFQVMAVALMFAICSCNDTPKSSMDEATATEDVGIKKVSTVSSQPSTASSQPSTASSQPSTVSSQPSTVSSQPSTPNKALFGSWSNNTDPNIYMVLAEKYGTYDERKGYGYLTAANDFYEYDFILVFTSITSDGDNIKVHYNKMESYCTGDPDDYDSESEWVEKKVGEGDLTIIPQAGNKVKIDSKEKRIRNKVLSKSK